jgi:hypothetical protein
MKPLQTAIMLVTMLLAAPMANAAGQATPDEAKAMAIKAAGYLKSAGVRRRHSPNSMRRMVAGTTVISM